MAKSILGNSVMVAQLTLDQLVKVRILVPQWFVSLATSETNHPEQVSPKGERVEG